LSKKRPKEENHKAHFESIASVITTVQIYPAEAHQDIRKLREAIWADLKPGSPYEEYVTEEAIQRILEVKRLRQLRKSLLEVTFQNAAWKALNLTSDNGDESTKETELYHKIISDVRDAAAIRAIDQQLDDYGTSLDVIQLNAYRRIASDLGDIDKRLDLLEKKLRHVHQHLESIQAVRRRTLATPTSSSSR
jgi:hypothetical protein